jgi:hypothetical protein
MGTAVGVGRSTNRNSSVAAVEAAELAMAGLRGRRPDLALVFATAGHDQPTLVARISEVLGPVPLSGCSAEGVITRAGSDEGTHSVGLMLIASDELRFRTFRVGGVDRDPHGAAEQLAAQIKATEIAGKLLLLFPDGVTANCTALLETLQRTLPNRPVIVGGTAGDLLRFESTSQYHDGTVASHAVSAVWVGGDFCAEVGVSHGSDLIGLEREVTRAELGYVQEIDGQPAWDFFRQYLDPNTKGLDALAVAHLAVAERLPSELQSEFGDHVIRVPSQLDNATGALFFAGGLRTGAHVQMVVRNPDKVSARAAETARVIATRHPGVEPLLVLQFDCAGRGRLLFGEETDRYVRETMQSQFPVTTPWLGLHTYGEIAELKGVPCFHNYTVALCALYPGCEERG